MANNAISICMGDFYILDVRIRPAAGFVSVKGCAQAKASALCKVTAGWTTYLFIADNNMFCTLICDKHISFDFTMDTVTTVRRKVRDWDSSTQWNCKDKGIYEQVNTKEWILQIFDFTVVRVFSVFIVRRYIYIQF